MPFMLAGLAALAVAVMGMTITDLGPWYRSLAQPGWAPPDPVYGIVWTTIYALAAIASVLAWNVVHTRRDAETLIGLFAFNGFLNILWSLIFFRMQRPDWALAELIVFWGSIAALILFCVRRSRVAGLLLVPYLVWVTIAGLLNWEIVRLNGPFG
ncbi:TspO/MBR family protein [Sphingomonas changnyeongensis]|nr:TspO/MBR family protein [Sphingomonas changnyeongensis]